MAQQYGLQIDEAKMKEALRQYFIDALLKVEEKFLDIMQEEIMHTVYGKGPGKPEWREAMRKDLHHLYTKIAGNIITVACGLQYPEGSADEVRAMLVAYGGGSRADPPNPPIQRRPGEQVWDSDLSAKKTSTAKSAGLLPDEFNQEGNDWLTNAKKRIVSYQLDIIMATWANLYPNFFSQYVHGVKR